VGGQPPSGKKKKRLEDSSLNPPHRPDPEMHLQEGGPTVNTDDEAGLLIESNYDKITGGHHDQADTRWMVMIYMLYPLWVAAPGQLINRPGVAACRTLKEF
jgi:hypothetical protein